MAEDRRQLQRNPQNLPMEYDPEVLRVAQRQADQMRMIAELEHAIAQWKERAVVAEKLNESLDQHIKSIERDFSRERDEARHQYRQDVTALTGERDHWKDQYIRTEEGLTIAANIILDVMNKAATRKEVNSAGLKEVAEAITQIGSQPGNGANSERKHE
jgi:hypothetical protein